MTEHGDKSPPDNFVAPSDPSAWTQRELEMLHEMVRDYDRARWFRGQLKWWGLWLVGLPTAAVAVWEPLDKLFRMVRGN